MHDKFIAKQGGLDPEEQSIDPENFQLLHIQRDTAGEGDDYVSKISGTKVREAIRNNDVETFKRMVPQCLYPLFFKFQKALRELEEPEQEMGAQQEPAYQSAAINEMIDEITKRIMKQLLK